MKTLEDIKESLSNEYFLGSKWNELPDDQKVMLIDKICHRAQEELQKRIADNVSLPSMQPYEAKIVINSITDPSNIVK